MNPRSLPVRVEPYEDEPWNGYLARVATAHRLPLSDLYVRLGVARSKAPGAVNWGLAMTDSTMREYADFLNLDPVRVHAMLLQRFDGTALLFDEDVVRHLDPSDRFRLQYIDGTFIRIGWLHARPASKWCTQCLNDDPARWYLSWRLPWHVQCERHDRLLSVAAESAGDRSRASTTAVAAQRRLLDFAYGRVRPPRRSAVQYIRDVQAAAETLLSVQGERVVGPPPEPRRLRLVLAVAVAAADTPAGCPSPAIDVALQDLSGLAAASVALRRHGCGDVQWLRGRVSDHGIAADWRGLPMWACHVPSEHRSRDAISPAGGIRWIPQMMPTEVFNGALSDLVYSCVPDSGVTRSS